jgi:hypothetical protein
MDGLVWTEASGVPAGPHTGEFLGVEPFENEHGPGVKWRWKVTEGQHAGGIATRITGLKPTPKNSCGKMLVALLGRTPTEGERIDPASYVGKRYLIVVEATQSGGTRVCTVAPQ